MGVGSTAPVLSMVVPVYRVEEYLPACLDSLLAEADDRVEVVAVDDGSPDGSGDILRSYAERDRRVRVLRLPSNIGLGQARNAGLEYATGEYVWFVDADDEVPAGAVPAVLDRLSATRPDVLIVDHAEVFDDGLVVRPPSQEVLRGVTGPINLRQRPQLLNAAQSACTKIARREFLDEIKLRFCPGWYEDSSFSHPLLMNARRIDVLDRVCYHYRQRHRSGITKTVSHRHFEVFDQYRRLFDAVSAAGDQFHDFRPHLFRLMIDHYLVILGNEFRLPPRSRPEFFRRMVADYRGRLPEQGYEKPAGTAALKHWLVRHNAYCTYALLRRLHRTWRRLVSGRSPAGPAAPAPAAPAPAGPAPAPPRRGRTTGQ